MSQEKPLVSIIVYNYNYGEFLEQCLESAVNQTYGNVEILFTDNASEDDSWRIALDFSGRYPDLFSISKHRRNRGSSANFRHWHSQLSGQYHIGLCADDVLHPKCIELSVKALEANKDCAFLIFARSLIQGDLTETFEPPFLNCDCIMEPPGLSLLYMMTGFNATNSQVIYRTPKSPHNLVVPLYEEGQFRSFFRTRMQDFLISMDSPAIYLQQPLVKHRVHDRNHARFAELNMIDVMGQYSLNFEFLEQIAGQRPEWRSIFEEQLQRATKKHAMTALRYSGRFVLSEEIRLAKQYLSLSCALDPDCKLSEQYGAVTSAIDSFGTSQFENEKASLKLINNLIQRDQSYEPPSPWRPLNS